MAKGLSGIAVAALGIGGVLMYAGFRGVNPIQALRDVGGGKPPEVDPSPVTITPGTGNWAPADPSGSPAGGTNGGVNGSVVAAAGPYMADRYSQLRRTQVGWSDCSSFVDKILVDLGVPPPVKWAATGNFRAATDWETIPKEQAMSGDIAVSGGHIVILTGPRGEAAIGQQNSRTNVRTGSVASLMGSQSYVYRKYVGKR